MHSKYVNSDSFGIPEFRVEFPEIDIGNDVGRQFHLISSTEFKFTVTNNIFTKMKEMKKRVF